MVDDNDDTENDLASLYPCINDVVFIMNIRTGPIFSDVIALSQYTSTIGYNAAIHQAHQYKLPTTAGRIDLGIIIDKMPSSPLEHFVVLISGEKYVIASCWLEVASRC